MGVDAVEDHLAGVHAHVDAEGVLVDGDAVDAYHDSLEGGA